MEAADEGEPGAKRQRLATCRICPNTGPKSTVHRQNGLCGACAVEFPALAIHYRKFGVSCTDNGLCRKAGPADAKPAGVNGWGKGCGCRAQCKCAAPSAAV